jgi:hypothetical protein
LVGPSRVLTHNNCPGALGQLQLDDLGDRLHDLPDVGGHPLDAPPVSRVATSASRASGAAGGRIGEQLELPLRDARTGAKFSRTTFRGRRVYRNTEDITPDVPSYVSRERVHAAVLKRLDNGASNLDLMKSGLAPIGRDGLQINLHHVIGQEPGPWVELLTSTHQRHSSALHGLIRSGASFRNNPSLLYGSNKFRKAWWKLKWTPDSGQ